MTLIPTKPRDHEARERERRQADTLHGQRVDVDGRDRDRPRIGGQHEGCSGHSQTNLLAGVCSDEHAHEVAHSAASLHWNSESSAEMRLMTPLQSFSSGFWRNRRTLRYIGMVSPSMPMTQGGRFGVITQQGTP